MNTMLPILMSLVFNTGGDLAKENRVNTNCQEIASALQAASQGLPFEGEFVTTQRRVVTLLDHESDPTIPDFLCESPLHIASSGIKVMGEGDVLIKLKDHANAPLLIIGTLKSIPGDQYENLSAEEKQAMRLTQIHVENLRLDGNRLKQDHECWTFESCDSWDHPLSAIRNNGVTVRYSDFVTLINIKVKSTISGGFVAERYSNNIFVDGYESDDNFFDGFTAYQTSNSVFKNLSLNDNLAAGISLDLDVKGNSFINVSIKNTRDVGVFARATHHNYFKNMTIDHPGNHGIFLARHPTENLPPDVEGQIPWDTVTSNVFEELVVKNSQHGVGIRVNDKECINNRLTRYRFENNAFGDISQAQEGMLIIDPQEERLL